MTTTTTTTTTEPQTHTLDFDSWRELVDLDEGGAPFEVTTKEGATLTLKAAKDGKERDEPGRWRTNIQRTYEDEAGNFWAFDYEQGNDENCDGDMQLREDKELYPVRAIARTTFIYRQGKGGDAAPKTTTLTEDQRYDMAVKIGSEGFHYYFAEGGWWEDEAKADPKIGELAKAYFNAADALKAYLNLPEI